MFGSLGQQATIKVTTKPPVVVQYPTPVYSTFRPQASTGAYPYYRPAARKTTPKKTMDLTDPKVLTPVALILLSFAILAYSAKMPR